LFLFEGKEEKEEMGIEGRWGLFVLSLSFFIIVESGLMGYRGLIFSF